MTQKPYVVNLIPGEPEFGVWCDECLLPSAVTVPIALSHDGVPCGNMKPVTFCECGWVAP